MSDKFKQHIIYLDDVYHVEVDCRVGDGYFILSFYGTTKKGKRYKINLRLTLWIIRHIIDRLLTVRAKLKEFMNLQFGAF